MLWRKKYIFINLSWHGGCGQLLSSFDDLEVPLPHNFVTFRVASPFGQHLIRHPIRHLIRHPIHPDFQIFNPMTIDPQYKFHESE